MVIPWPRFTPSEAEKAYLLDNIIYIETVLLGHVSTYFQSCFVYLDCGQIELSQKIFWENLIHASLNSTWFTIRTTTTTRLKINLLYVTMYLIVLYLFTEILFLIRLCYIVGLEFSLSTYHFALR